MSFPVNLSPSPVVEVFPFLPKHAAVWVEQLDLSQSDVSLLQKAEDHVLQYTLSSRSDATKYVRLLLHMLDRALALQQKQGQSSSQRQPPRSSAAVVASSTSSSIIETNSTTTAATTTNSSSNSSVDTTRLKSIWYTATTSPNHKTARLSLDDATILFHDPSTQRQVVTHYAVTKLCEVVQALNERMSISRRKHTTKRNQSQGNGSMVADGASSMASIFYPDGILIEDWRPLLRLLMNNNTTAAFPDIFAHRGSAYVLACILLEGRSLEDKRLLLSPIESVIESFLTWLTSRLQSSDARCLHIVTPSLTVLLFDRHCRRIFDQKGGIGSISRHLRARSTPLEAPSFSSTASTQQLYELCYGLWLLSYDCEHNEMMRKHFRRDGAVTALVDLVASAPREKVVRLALSTLKNLAMCHHDDVTAVVVRDPSNKKIATSTVFLCDMIVCGLLKTLDLMKEREFTDPELLHDMENLHRRLTDICCEMSRWDVYEAEVQSGRLQWSLAHSDKFFKENAKRMEGKDGNFAIVKELLKLAVGYDEDVAAIALFDIGEFIKYYPNGRAVAKGLGARDVVMKLMDHENPGLQRHAIQCMSKMLIQNWQAVA